MYHSVEARVPFIDKQLLKLTIAYRAREITEKKYSVRKIPLRKTFRKIYPDTPFERGLKKGFLININRYMKKGLKPYITDILSTNTLFTNHINFEHGIAQMSKNNSKYPFTDWSLLSLQLWAIKYNNWTNSI